MEKENNVYGQCVHGNNMANCSECHEIILNGFAFQVKCECQQRGCRHCDPHNEIPLPNFDLDPEPDWDEMKKDFEFRMESNFFYCLELKNHPGIYLAKKNGVTGHMYQAERFFGKDGKIMATLFLHLNQEMGHLKNFVVKELKFS